MSDDPSIAFVGGGNMARSLISGLIGAGRDPARIRVSDPLPAQRELLEELGVVAEESNDAAVSGADVVVLAVKPQVLGTAVKGLSLNADQLLLSIAAGVPTRAITGWSAPDQPIVRAMPNTPALLGAGVTGLYANAAVSAGHRTQAAAILSAVGRIVWVDEEAKLDAVTAVSGSGPAYFFYLMEAMIEAGVGQGLDVETATVLTLETAYGAALMARERTEAPGTLRVNVTSPGGTTEAALEALEAADTAAIVRRALDRAAARSRELAQEFGA